MATLKIHNNDLTRLLIDRIKESDNINTICYLAQEILGLRLELGEFVNYDQETGSFIIKIKGDPEEYGFLEGFKDLYRIGVEDDKDPSLKKYVVAVSRTYRHKGAIYVTARSKEEAEKLGLDLIDDCTLDIDEMEEDTDTADAEEVI